MNLYFYPVLSWMYPILLCVYPIKSCFNPIVKTVYVALCLSDNPENHFQVTVPTTLTFTFLFYSIVRVSYSIVRLSYPIACILSSFCLSYRENGLSGFAFIMWIGIPRHFHEQINEKHRNLLHVVIIVGLLNIADFYLP